MWITERPEERSPYCSRQGPEHDVQQHIDLAAITREEKRMAPGRALRSDQSRRRLTCLQNAKGRFQPRFRIWEARFCPNQLDLHGLAKTEEEQNSAARNYLDLWKKESGFARDAPSSDSLWRAERFGEVSGEDRICRSGGQVCSHPIALSQRHRSGGDLHGLFDLGGERGTALCAHRTAPGRSRVAPPAGDRAFPER